MIANAAPPEAQLVKVAEGQVIDLETPIFIAAAFENQIWEFMREEAFHRSEIRRIKRISDCGKEELPPGKILLLMPGWDLCHSTRETVEWWVSQDRYTVALETYPVPYPRRKHLNPWMILLLSAIAWAVIVLISINI